MRSKKVQATRGCMLLLLLSLSVIQFAVQGQPAKSTTPFELKNGDRVVFLGNSLFENDFQYGYLELALTTRFPDRDVTFRNLGWTGDDVWGDARSTYTNPPTAYQHLINNIIKTQPTLVFLGYGGVEAQEGEAGLGRFRDGLNKLLDKIDSLGARTILLSPVPVMSTDTAVHLEKRNADLELYASAISKIATDRGKTFIDVYKPILDISKKTDIIENGVHLNETGYYYLTQALLAGLGIKSENKGTTIQLTKQGAEASPDAKLLTTEASPATVKFAITEKELSLPPPQGMHDNLATMKIAGLKKGYYTLKANDMQVVTASAADWQKGVEIAQGPSFAQAQEVRKMILKKNDIHFFQYRPMNETYIIGFRSYEQGRHIKGLEQQNILITWLEGQIALNRNPRETVYELVPLK